MSESPAQPRRRNITPADQEAARRLKAIWDERASDLGLTQEKMAELIEGSQGLVSQYLNCKIALNYRALLAFCAALGIDDPEEIRGDLPEQRFVRERRPGEYQGEWIDVLGYNQPVALGDGAHVADYVEAHRLKFRASSLQRKKLWADTLCIYYGDGDSMEPRIHKGDAVMFDTADTRPRDGKLFAIQLADTISVKRCEIIEDVAYFRADNPDGDHRWKKPRRMDNPREPITILGRVRWIGSWED